MLPHNKIIKTTVKKFLEPEKLFQIGKKPSYLADTMWKKQAKNFCKGAKILRV